LLLAVETFDNFVDFSTFDELLSNMQIPIAPPDQISLAVITILAGLLRNVLGRKPHPYPQLANI
jgi:hypothetical protein